MRVLLSLGIPLIVAGAVCLHADPIFSADAGPFSAEGGPCLVTLAGGDNSSVPIGANISCSDSSPSTATGISSSNIGRVGASATSFNESNTSNPAAGGADAIYSDTVVFTSSNPADSFVFTSINLSANGSLTESDADASVTFTALINGQPSMAYTVDSSGGLVTCHGTIGPDPSCSDTLTSAVLTGSGVVVPLNTPVVFELKVSAFALSSEGFSGFPESASALFADTLELPSSGPVFNLPDGVTANSASSFIFNDQFQTTPLSGTPEPATWPVVSIVIAALVWQRNRHRATREERT